MLTNSKAIVLRTTKYGDTKLFVDMFCEKFGRITMVSSNGGKSKKKSRNHLFQPLNIIEIEFDMRPKATIQTITEVRMSYPFSSIPFNPYKLSISIFLADFMQYALRDELENVYLYRFIENSIILLDSIDKSYSNFHLVFMLRISMFLGIYPNMDTFYPGSFFNMREGCFSPLIPPHSDFLKPDESAALSLLMRINYRSMGLLRLSHTERNRCAAEILKYYRLHIPNFPELKSFCIMQELFS